MDNIMMDSDMLMEESLEKILELLENKKYFQARDELLKYNGVDIAELLEEVTEETDIDMTIILFRLLPKDVSVEVFSELPTDDQVEIVNGITDKEITFIVQEMDFDDKIDVLEELPANVVDKILEKTPKNERKLINTFFKLSRYLCRKSDDTGLHQPAEGLVCGRSARIYQESGHGCGNRLYLLRQRQRQKADWNRVSEYSGYF